MKLVTKAFLVISLGTLISSVSFAQFAVSGRDAGGDSGNGGGGILKDGRYMTFGSAGEFVVDRSELSEEQIPNLTNLVLKLENSQIMTDDTRSSLLIALEPSDSRHYYRIQPGSFSQTDYNRILAEYSRLFGKDANQLTLFAITDTQAKTTMLLPSFYGLKPNEQMAILFHEAHWIQHPKADYKTVVNAEIDFQATLDNPGDVTANFRFLRDIGSPNDQLKFCLQSDLATGAISDLIKYDRKSKFPTMQMSTLLGEQATACAPTECDEFTSMLTANLFKLSSTHPKSLLLRLLRENQSQGTSNTYYWPTKLGFVHNGGTAYREAIFTSLGEGTIQLKFDESTGTLPIVIKKTQIHAETTVGLEIIR